MTVKVEYSYHIVPALWIEMFELTKKMKVFKNSRASHELKAEGVLMQSMC